jgi:hypothetical protein
LIGRVDGDEVVVDLRAIPQARDADVAGALAHATA